MRIGPQLPVVMLLARDLAVNSATAMFLVDTSGTLVYYNEPAEAVLGLRFAETGPLSAHEWGTRWQPVDDGGRPLDVTELPLAIAVSDQRPAHRAMRINRPDGSSKQIEVTAFPLYAHSDDFAGALALFWVTDG